MEPWLQAVIVSATTVLASSGFWAFVLKKSTSKTATTRLLMGLAYDKIAQVGLNHIERGWITKDEYEDFRKYLYEPYSELGGNGVSERIMAEVTALPLRTFNERYSQIVKIQTQTRSDDGDASFE